MSESDIIINEIKRMLIEEIKPIDSVDFLINVRDFCDEQAGGMQLGQTYNESLKAGESQ